MEVKNEVFYLGIDYLEVNAYAVYLSMLGYDYHRLMLSFWKFPFNVNPKAHFYNLASRFEFNEKVVEKGLKTFYDLDRQVKSLKSHQQLFQEIIEEERAERPMLWITDSKTLPYHWTYKNDKTNHSHIVVAVRHTKEHIHIMDPGWVDDIYILDKSEIQQSVHNFRVHLDGAKPQENNQIDFSFVLSHLMEDIRDDNIMMFDRMEEFNHSVRNHFHPEREIVPIDNNRSRIWRNPLIRNLNEIAKYRYHLSEAFLYIWGDAQENARWIAEQFLEASKQWNTLKFMFSHILMQNRMDENQREKLYLAAAKILEVERKIYSFMESI